MVPFGGCLMIFRANLPPEQQHLQVPSPPTPGAATAPAQAPGPFPSGLGSFAVRPRGGVSRLHVVPHGVLFFWSRGFPAPGHGLHHDAPSYLKYMLSWIPA